MFLSRGGGDTASAAGSFSGTAVTTLSSLTAGANANTTITLSIPITDYNFSSVINGTPSAAFVAPGPGRVEFSAATHPDVGEVMGTLASTSTLGLTGNPCGSAVTPSFVFLNATVDTTDVISAVPQSATNPGSGATLDNMWSDDGASTTGPDADAPWNDPGGWADPGATIEALTVAEQANGLPAQVDDYPYYLNKLFDPDYSTGDPFDGTDPVQPWARYAGAVNVVGTSVVLDLVIFAPGALSAAFPAPHPFNATSTIGYTSIAVLNDATVEAAHGSISDFCAPLGTTTVINGMGQVNPCDGNPAIAACDTPGELSNPAGGASTQARYANPASGTYSWVSQLQSLRDADEDGIENSLDACNLVADKYNPRSLTGSGSDNDDDGMPDECDPNDTDGNTDHDGDGWENSYDNCPLVSNPTQSDAEAQTAYGTTAPFGGPRGDSIGDACDASDDTTGQGDGYSELEEAREPLCANSSNDDDKTGAGLVADDTLVNDGCATMGLAETTCTGAVDEDGDGYVNDGCPSSGSFSEASFKIGTDAADRCGVGNEGAGLPSGAWPSDLYSGGVPVSTDKINVLDVTSFIAPPATKKLDTAPGQANFNSRWDLTPGRQVFNNMINVTDLTSLIAANPKGFPPMFSGGTVKAFSGPVCTAATASTLSNGSFLTNSTTNTYTMP